MRITLIALVLLAACRCDDTPPPVRKAQAPRPRKDEALLTNIPKAEGTPMSADALASALPASLGEATPEGDPQIETTPLSNDGTLPAARRVYVKDGTRIIVQVSDMLHAPLMQQMMLEAKDKAEKAPSESWKGATISGHDAVLQHLPAQNAAMANIAVTDRVFVNVRVEPADTVQAALGWAEKVPLDAITKLAATASPPAAPSPSAESAPVE